MRLIQRFFRKNVVPLSLMTLIFLFIVVLFANRIFISIPSGHAGVLWERFGKGTDIEQTYPEGFHIIFPWNIMNIYSVRLNEATSTISVLSKDGLHIDVEFLVRYRPKYSELGFLHKYLGMKYLDILILPEVNSNARSVISEYTPEQIYSLNRMEIQERIERGVKQELLVLLDKHERSDLITIDDVLIKKIKLPNAVRKAIEAKIENKHRMLQYDYIIQREEKESKRKAIEAAGIRKFQDIIKGGISEPYLKWKGIDATLELARSNNAKVVVIGSGENGLPIILGNMDQNPVPVPSSPIKEPTKKDKEVALDKKAVEQTDNLIQRALNAVLPSNKEKAASPKEKAANPS